MVFNEQMGYNIMISKIRSVNMDEIIEKVKEILPKKRFDHVVRVVDMSLKLAKIYNSDIDKVKKSAYLHDIAKFFTLEEMLDLLDENEIEKEYVVREFLHGFAGAIYVKKEFQIDDEDILNGIRYHTVGRKGMSQIEKIVYLADAIEEGRDYEGVQEIRELAYKNLDKAILMEANHKIKYLIDIGVVLHPNTVEMRNWILKVIKEEEK